MLMDLNFSIALLMNYASLNKQGRIHGNPVANSWAGAVMRKPLAIQKCFGWTSGPTDQHGKVLSRVSVTNKKWDVGWRKWEVG